VYHLGLDIKSGMVWQYASNEGVVKGGTGRASLRALVGELLTLVAAGRPPDLDFFRPRPLAVVRWTTEDVMGLVRGIAADRAADRLPILADALEEAGCDDNRVLSACRCPEHPDDGWWVIDLLLAVRALNRGGGERLQDLQGGRREGRAGHRL
jgi:hypothetical protein